MTITSVGVIPNGEATFLDANGEPLAGGSVTFYLPGTTTPKNTWQDSGQVTPNANPLTLDSAGRAIIWGYGTYRQIVKDSSGNTIWDQNTRALGSAFLGYQTFTSSGTYTPTAGATLAVVYLVGGGGGGGGCAATSASNNAIGTGGGGGGLAIKSIASPTAQTITIGAGGTAGANTGGAGGNGGTTSFGGIFSATGGVGGQGGTNSAVGTLITGAAGGNGSGGDTNGAGGYTASVLYITAGAVVGSGGGSSFFGAGGAPPASSGAGNAGNNAVTVGSGGSGAVNSQSQGAGHAGGTGAAGYCLVFEYA